LGAELTLFNQVFFPGRGNATRPLSVIVGSFLTIGSESGSISSQNLEPERVNRFPTDRRIFLCNNLG